MKKRLGNPYSLAFAVVACTALSLLAALAMMAEGDKWLEADWSGKLIAPIVIGAVWWWSLKMAWLSRVELEDGCVVVRNFLKRVAAPAYMVSRVSAHDGVRIILSDKQVLWCMPLTSSLIGDIFGNKVNLRCAEEVERYVKTNRRESRKRGGEKEISLDLNLGVLLFAITFSGASCWVIATLSTL
ncbi:hypothetical protein [Nocardiopsis suaedae]|uniref:PH domain-containing protein n=1 Tax=Nocardiopsis suaedae TaxID=3018444 RepID=A0ABT4TJT5_9ACTN|nr:hypothetical protein [Nocardiopsis suaedae]MDA2804930.1 hypothetical protein [Nocardiopsis suaedae]